jgi:hypothetical protein
MEPRGPLELSPYAKGNLYGHKPCEEAWNNENTLLTFDAR